MKKLRKYSKVILLAFVCCCLSIFITYQMADKLSTVYAAEDTTTRGEWMSILVDTFDMVIEDGVVPDDYYGDISESEYYEDILVAMNFGVIELEAGEDFEPEGAVTREFAAQTLNYCLGFQLDADAEYTMSDKDSITYVQDAQVAINRGWFELVDGAFSPTTAMTLAERTAMLTDAEIVWNSTTVDTEYENTYVFADKVVEVPLGTEVTVSEEGTVSIIDCPVTISENDTFVIYENELPQTYKAVTVVENEGTTTITTNEVEFDTVCEQADAQGEVEADLTQAVPLTEGVTITYDEEDSEVASIATYGSSRAIKKVKPINVSCNINGIQLTCKIKNIKVEYINKSNEKYLGVKGDATISATAKASKSLSVPLVDVPVAGVGHVTVSMEYSVTGTITLTYSTDFVMGVSYSKYDGFRAVKEFHKKSFSFNARVDASVYCRLAVSADVLGAFSGIVYADVGIKGSANYDSYGDGKTPENCLDVSAYVFVRVGYDVSIPGKSWDDAYYIYDKNNTPVRICYHMEDGVTVNSCARGKTTSSGKKSKYYTSKYSGTSTSGDRITISTYCDSGFIGDDTVTIYEYTTDDDGNATITKYNGCAYSLIIPGKIDGYQVTKIGSSAFKNNTYIRSVVIPDSVMSIGSSAFHGCTNLESVNFPENKNYSIITENLFYKCSSLDNIILPNNMEIIYGGAFSYCTDLSQITIPNTLKKVYNGGPFEHCDSLREVTFEKGITIIPSNIFSNCTGLETLILPDTITRIEAVSFNNCSNLRNLELPNSLEYIGRATFHNCTSIEKINIPKSLVEADSWGDGSVSKYGPFSNCSNLKEVFFQEGITMIAGDLFGNCTGLERIVIPDTVMTIGSYAFTYCSNLKEITFSEGLITIEAGAFYKNTSLETVEISDSVTSIGANAFSHCSKLNNVKLPRYIQTLGLNSFGNCTGIETIFIPKSIQKAETSGDGRNPKIGPFSECSNLKVVEFEEGISKIPGGLFGNCTGLEEIIIPNSVTEIGDATFTYCSNLSDIQLSDKLISVGQLAFYKCSSLTKVEIPDSVEYMGSSIFSECANLQEVHIPNIRINLPSSTFYNCTSLTEVNFPDTLEIIGSNAFYNCTSLTEVNLPSKVNTINSSAFYGCTGLTKVTIPASMRTIYSSAFSHCEALTDLTIAEGVTEIGSNAFEYCKSLQKVTLPDSLQTLGSYAFRYCDTLSEVNIGAGLKIIPSYCFYEDPALEKIILPQQVTTINEYAFGNCTAFKDITINRNVTSAAVNAFSYPDNLTIHGISGTYAQTFAHDNEILFIPLDAPATAIKLNATEKRLARGYTAQMTANITPADSSDQLTWTSSDEDIVTVDANGQIKGIATGTATIIAMAGDVMEFCEVTVYEKVTSVYLNGSSKEFSIGETYQLEATVYPTNATNKNISWSSSDEKVATVDDTGLVTAIAYGTATITVTTEDSGCTDTFTVTIKPIAVTGVSLNVKTATVGVNATYQLTANITPENATMKDVTWSSSKAAVATVDANGLVTGVSEGTAIIIAKTKDGSKTASCTVTVKDLSVTGVTLDKTELELESKTSYQLTESILPMEATNKNVTWSSDNEEVATVKNGKVIALRAGTATITVTTEDGGYTASCLVTVIGEEVTGVELSKETLSMEVGNLALLEAYVSPADADGTSVTWSTSDANVATIDSETGVVTAIAVGTATITVTTNDGGYEAACEVTVTESEETEGKIAVTDISIIPVEEDVHVEDSFTLTVTITPAEATNQDVIWLSSDTDIAKISQGGEVTTYGVGEVTITAISVDGGKIAEYVLEILPVSVTGIELECESFGLAIGDTECLDYDIYPANATNKDVTWSSSNESVATITAGGTIRALRVGTTTITVTTEDGGFEASCELTVSPILAESIELNETKVSLTAGETKQLSATVYPSDTTDKRVGWISSNPSVATVSDSGKVTAVAEGTANIVVAAEDGSGVKMVCVVTVTKKEQPPAENPPVDNPPAENPPNTENQNTKQPATTTKLPKVGTKVTVSSGQYKITKSTSKTKEVTFVKPKSSTKTSVTIPATIKINGYTYKVTEISAKACKNNKKLKSVTIGKNVKKIGKEAFYNCKKLKKITIKSTVLKSVDKNAIKNIDKKATIKVPKKQLSKYKNLFKSKTGYKKTMKIKK